LPAPTSRWRIAGAACAARAPSSARRVHPLPDLAACTTRPDSGQRMVAVNARGVGAIVMSLVGPTTFPSAAYAKVRGGEVPGVHGDVEHPHLEQLGTSALAYGTGFAEGCFQLGRGRHPPAPSLPRAPRGQRRDALPTPPAPLATHLQQADEVGTSAERDRPAAARGDGRPELADPRTKNHQADFALGRLILGDRSVSEFSPPCSFRHCASRPEPSCRPDLSAVPRRIRRTDLTNPSVPRTSRGWGY